MSEQLRRLTVRDGIHTHGGAGDSLVKGVITRLSAHALSVLPGGTVESIEIGGALTSAGADVTAVDVRGEIAAMRVGGGVHARGASSDAIHVDAGLLKLTGTQVAAADGKAVRVTNGGTAELHQVSATGARGEIVADDTSTVVTNAVGNTRRLLASIDRLEHGVGIERDLAG